MPSSDFVTVNQSLDSGTLPDKKGQVSKSIWDYVLWPAALLLVIVNAAILFRLPLQVDIAWYLYAGKEMLAGKRLYVDILENNPPLICFLNEIPNWLSHVLHLNVKLVWMAFASFCAVVPAIFSLYLLDRLGILWGWRRALTGFVLVAACIVPFADNAFGERDHFAFVAMLPLVFLLANRIAGTKLPLVAVLLVGGYAGLFLALKPYFLVPWALCLLYVFWQMRWQVLRQPETYLVPACVALHFLLIVAVTPAYFAVVKLASQWYGGYNVGVGSIAKSLFRPIAVTVLSVFYRPGLQYRPMIRLLSLFTFGWVLSGILQQKGSAYHLLPAFVALSLLVYFIVLDLWSREVWRQISFAPVSLAGLGVAFLVFGYVEIKERSLPSVTVYFDDSSVLLPILRSAGHARAVFLSTALIAFPTVNETEVEFGNTYPHLWTMPGLYAAETHSLEEDRPLEFHDFSAMPAAEHDILNRTYSDLLRKPQLIIVDAHKYKWGMGTTVFDFEDYFRRDERIQKLWSNYRELPAVPNFRIYQLIDAPETSAK
jgi:hypothetical protein